MKSNLPQLTHHIQGSYTKNNWPTWDKIIALQRLRNHSIKVFFSPPISELHVLLCIDVLLHALYVWIAKYVDINSLVFLELVTPFPRFQLRTVFPNSGWLPCPFSCTCFITCKFFGFIVVGANFCPLLQIANDQWKIAGIASHIISSTERITKFFQVTAPMHNYTTVEMPQAPGVTKLPRPLTEGW